MNIAQRDEVVQRFQNDSTTGVMLASLKSGGTGLNLTMASKVILVDLWWNSSIEQQAFCRVFRRGQERETQMVRMVVTNSIDDKLLALQERKDKEIGSIMKEELNKKMTMKDLMDLFGVVGSNDRSREYVINSQDRDPAPPEHVMITEDNEEYLRDKTGWTTLRDAL